MKYTALSIAAVLLLSACTSTQTKVPACSGDTIRGCKPVVYFDSGSSAIKKDQRETLNWTVEKMKRWPRKHVKVTGHTDSFGEANKNWTLSKNRALAVKKYLVQKGIDSERIVTEFKGELERVCTQKSCAELNRRAELLIAAPNGGWEPIDWEGTVGKVKCAICEDE